MTTLTDRYLAATLRSVPATRRPEIATELRASIEDMIEGRVGAGGDAAAAEREVLTELGDPARLAARYAGRRLQLIGPTYYLVWERLLVRLLTVLPVTVGVVVGVVDGLVRGGGGAVGAGISAAFQVAVQTTFWVTLTFAVIERTNTRLDLPDWTVDRLPDAPVDREVPLAETVASVALTALLVAWLPWQHVRSFVEDERGRNVPILDPALWSSWLPVLIVVLLAGIVLQIVRYRVGRWTWSLVAAKAVLDLAVVVPSAWLLVTGRLLNPALVERVTWLGAGDNLTRLGTGVAVVVVAAVAWDLGSVAVRTYRASAR